MKSMVSDDIKSKFNAVKIKKPVLVREPLDKNLYASNKELTRRNNVIIRLLAHVVDLMQEFKEFAHLLKLVNDAVYYSHLYPVTNNLLELKNQLTIASKIVSWNKIKKNKSKIQPNNLEKHIDIIHELITKVISELKKDNDKRNGKYFLVLKNSIVENLPITLNNNISVRKAPVLIMTKQIIAKHVPCEQIQDGLYLLKEATLVGTANDNKRKKKIDEVRKLAIKKCKGDIYSIPLHQKQSNIDWYLVLDFGVDIQSAMFVSSMSIPDDNKVSGEFTSFEEYAWAIDSHRKRKEALLRVLQRDARVEFEDDEKATIATINDIKYTYDIYKEAELFWRTELRQLTILDDPDSSREEGLHPKSVKDIDNFFAEMMRRKMLEYDSNNTVRMRILQHRLDAKIAFFKIVEIKKMCALFKAQIKSLQNDLNERKVLAANQFSKNTSSSIDRLMQNATN